MASSSSSSKSFDQVCWNHDVFLSFRGEDTRKTFVDHLYSALLLQGIHTYKDDETLPRGASIGPALTNAIQHSRIAVVVFSENYADSSWCLEELSCIMKCKDTRGQIVMPIFYDVDPSEVRKQKRKYGEAFAKHDSENNNKVTSWRKAIVDASNISGWELKHIANGHESKGIKEIVDAISNRLLPLISNVNEDLIGMRRRVQDLKSQLEIGSGGVRMVGIWGVGGGGKTTLASSVYDEISSNFDCCSFVENIREKSSNGLEKLQEKLLSDVLKQNQVTIGRVHEGKSMIRRRLYHRNALIVLDDVDHPDQLKALAGSHDWFGEGSRIIITTRDEHVLKAHKVNEIHNISLLNDHEAMQLFCKHALFDCRPIEEYETLSKDVVSYAGGLPLALKVLGCFLCDKDVNEWRSALARLKEIPDTDIVEKLKISYDGLTKVEKELFLDIACFFRWNNKDFVMEILDSCGFHAVIGVKVLIQKALITVCYKGYDGVIDCFDMHDLVQELGHYIVRGEHPKNPEKRSRIWKMEDVRSMCSMYATMENDRTEAIDFTGFWDESADLANQVLANMKKLRWISGFNYPAILLPTNFNLMQLCYLGLKGEFKQLWEGYKHLPCLKVLDLHSLKLMETPDFLGLPSLERVILKNCIDLKEIHPSIGYHERLKYLDIVFCDRLEMFPPIICMKKLQTLKILFCYRLRKFPEIQRNMDSLVELELVGSGIKVVPSSIGEYCTSLVSLNLSDSLHLKRIEANLHLLNQLKTLQPQKSFQLGQAPSPLFFSHLLTSLNLSRCNIEDDDDIPSGIFYLSNLKALDLSGNTFSQLDPHSLSQLTRLKSLNLSSCHNLLTLPDLPSSLAILHACWCDSLSIVGDFPTNCRWLWKVSLKGTRIDSERVVQSMLQGNATEDYFMSLCLDHVDIPLWKHQYEVFRLQLPCNWDDDFTGFFIHIDGNKSNGGYEIILKQEMHMESDLLQVCEKTTKNDTRSDMCYISFGSLRHTSWWDSTYTQLSFQIWGARFHVELVPRKKREVCETATDCSEFWDEEYGNKKTFTILNDSKSYIEIEWRHEVTMIPSPLLRFNGGMKNRLNPVGPSIQTPTGGDGKTFHV